MSTTSEHISSASQQVVRSARTHLTTSRTTIGGPPSQAKVRTSFQTKDTFIPSSQSGLQDFNEAISRNKQLRALSQQGGNESGTLTFGRQAIPTGTGGAQRVGRGLVKIVGGAIATQADSPLPGPGDAVGAGMISSGVRDVGLGITEMLLAAPASHEFPDTERKDEECCRRAHPLHRAVGPNERKSLEKLGQFTPNPSGIEGKYFYPTKQQSIDFAHSRTNAHKPEMWRATGVLPHNTPHVDIHPAGEGPAFFVPNPSLPSIKHVRVRERIKPR